MARRRGWGGNPPVDDDDATRRIVTAAVDLIGRTGSAISIADIAESLGVIRQTVYRYFPNSDALMRAAAIASVAGFLDRLTAHVSGIEDPVDAMTEGVVYTLTEVRRIPHLGILLTGTYSNLHPDGLTSDEAQAFGIAMINRFDGSIGRSTATTTLLFGNSSNTSCARCSRFSYPPVIHLERRRTTAIPAPLDGRWDHCTTTVLDHGQYDRSGAGKNDNDDRQQISSTRTLRIGGDQSRSAACGDGFTHLGGSPDRHRHRGSDQIDNRVVGRAVHHAFRPESASRGQREHLLDQEGEASECRALPLLPTRPPGFVGTAADVRVSPVRVRRRSSRWSRPTSVTRTAI